MRYNFFYQQDFNLENCYETRILLPDAACMIFLLSGSFDLR